MNRFLSIGECMVEMAPAEGGGYAMGFAGDTFNTAWYVRRCLPPGVEVAYLSAVGDDAISHRMTAFIREAGIVPELAVRPDRTVGLYLISLDAGERSFSYWRDTSAARDLARNLDALAELARGDMAFFSGITLAILPDEGRRALLGQLAQARARGVRIAFDTNLRPKLWSGPDEMRDWVGQAAGVADIALPSFDDEAAHFGDADPAATARRYAIAGAECVVVKNGAGPVTIYHDGVVTEVTPEPVTHVVDTTAAGDSFDAGFLSALVGGASPDEAAQAGCQLSAAVIGARGALVDVTP